MYPTLLSSQSVTNSTISNYFTKHYHHILVHQPQSKHQSNQHSVLYTSSHESSAIAKQDTCMQQHKEFAPCTSAGQKNLPPWISEYPTHGTASILTSLRVWPADKIINIAPDYAAIGTSIDRQFPVTPLPSLAS